MRISARADYAVRALIELATAGSDRPVSAERLAEAQMVPTKFLENILAELRRAGIVTSRRGAVGGHLLARPPAEVTVADVVRAVDGPLANIRGERPDRLAYPGAAAPLRDVWIALRASMRVVLEGVTLADLAAGELPAAVRDLLDDPAAWEQH